MPMAPAEQRPLLPEPRVSILEPWPEQPEYALSQSKHTRSQPEHALTGPFSA